eukprot:12300234-Alexandrium_andersonii.AAC.1
MAAIISWSGLQETMGSDGGGGGQQWKRWGSDQANKCNEATGKYTYVRWRCVAMRDEGNRKPQ